MTCRVTTSTWSIKEKHGTGIYELGKFPLTDIEESASKSFKFDQYDANLSVNVSVEYGDFPAVERQKPTEIKLTSVGTKQTD